MLDGLQHAHSGLRWILLALLLWCIVKGLLGKSGGRFFDKTRKLALMTMIIAHVQLLIGFALYFMKGHYQGLSGEGMKVSLIRFFAMEHALGMLIAIVLLTIGYKKVKSAASDVGKYKAMFGYYLIALILILMFIPWPFRFETYGWI